MRWPWQSRKVADAFKVVRGISVPDLSGIAEGYAFVPSTTDARGYISANVSAERIARVFRKLAAALPEPGFFIIETPTHRDVESQLRKAPTDPMHVDVYFWDQISWLDADAVFSRFEDLFVDDGMVSFGFGSHGNGQEVFVAAYKIFRIYYSDPQPFEAAFHELGIPRVEKLRTVWDNFTRDRPGARSLLGGGGPSIYEMMRELSSEGFYLHGRRPG